MQLAAVLIAAALGPAPGAEPLPLKLQSVRETRELDVRPEEERPAFGNAGLVVTFEAGLPKGSDVLSIAQPTNVEAKDSTGGDLTSIRPGVFDEREYLKIEDWFDEASMLQVMLAPSSRKAESFSVSLRAEATIYSGVEGHDVNPVEEWTAFTHPALAAAKAEYRYRKPEEAGGALQVRPAAAREFIESIVPATEDAEPAGYSVSYYDEMASFDVAPLEPGQKLRIFVRKDIRKVPIVIDLKDQKLP